MKKLSGLIVFFIITVQCIYAFPAYAHGVIYQTEPVEGNKIRITLKWSDPLEKKGLRISYFNLKNGKTLNIGYDSAEGSQNSTYLDFDMSNALPPLRINLIPAGVIDYSVFSDVKGIEAQEYITHLHDAGIVNGKYEDRFAPEENITRAEFAALVVRALKLEGPAENKNGFTDIENHWAKNTLLLASEHGLMSGYEDGTIRPDNPITLAEASVLISRAFKFKTVNNGLYARLKQGEWYSAAVKKMFDSGILTISDSIYNHFDEEKNITRADCAIIISRALSTY